MVLYIESDAVLSARVYRYVDQMKYTHVDFSQNRQKTPVNDTFQTPITKDIDIFSVEFKQCKLPVSIQK